MSDAGCKGDVAPAMTPSGGEPDAPDLHQTASHRGAPGAPVGAARGRR
jgi:hypothetical protein